MQLSSGNYAVQDSTLSNLCNYKYIRASAIQDSSYKNAGYGLDQMNWPVGVSTDGTRLYVAGKKPVVLGFSDQNYSNKELGVSSNTPAVVVHPSESPMYMPSGLAYDGTNLWAGEFKFSSRLLLFRKQ